jgi:hypothetical protein
MHRARGAVLALVLIAGACGEGGDREATRTTVASGPVTTAGAPGAGTTSPSAPSGGDAGSSPTSTGGGAVAAPPTTRAQGALDPGGVGGLAAALLRPGHGDRVVVEARAQSGAAPAAGALDHVVRVLREASGKAVSVDGVDPLSGGAREWTARSIVAAAESARQHGQGGTQVTLRLLFLRGTFEGDDSVLGVAVRGDVAAVFSDRVDDAASLLVASSTIEDAVTVHEVGHLLGLVDLAIDTGRDDPSHPGHSTNERSVMHWAVESDLISQVLGGGVPTDFDAQDRADLARIRAG